MSQSNSIGTINANTDMASILKAIQMAVQQARFTDAINLVHESLKHPQERPQRQQLTYLLVVAQRLAGRLQDALSSVKELLNEFPDYARAYQEQGYIYQAFDDAGQAASSFYQATLHNPALLASWQNLLTFYQQQQNTAAISLAQQQINYLNGLPRPLAGAMDLLYEGRLEQADQVARGYLQQHKHDPEGMLILGKIALALHALNDAEFLLESCIELHPEHIQARAELAGLLAKLGKFKGAFAQAQILLEKRPDNPMFLIAKANAMVGLGELDGAISLYQQIIDADPERAAVHLLLGHAYKAQGNFSQAITAYKRCYQLQADFGDAYWSLANTKTYQFSEQELDDMKGLQQASKTAVDDRIHLSFSLGKAYEDQQSYDLAFDYYRQGNQLKKASIDYQIEHTSKQVDLQINSCTQALFERHKTAGCDAPDPIFIVGLPRAGSTLLEQILASHSKVDGTMELHNILGLAARLRAASQPYPANLEGLDSSYFKRFGEQYMRETQVYRDQAPFFIDKMPNNFLHIGLIKLILPNAKIIDARRHPMACCFSGYKQLFGEGQYFSYDLQDIGHYYQDYHRLMAHWDKVLPGQILRVQHEELVADLDGQVRRILEYCGLSFEHQCLDFYKTKRAIKTPSSEQVRQPIYTTGLKHWQHFSAHLQPLQDIVKDIGN